MPTKKRVPHQFMPLNPNHHYVISATTLTRINAYQNKLADGSIKPGSRLLAEINHAFARNKKDFDPSAGLRPHQLFAIQTMPPADFLQLLMNSRLPKVFGEGVSIGEGLEWNHDEYLILGGVASIVENTQVFDSGRWSAASDDYSDDPDTATLLCIPGGIFKNNTPDHRHATNEDGSLNVAAFKKIFKDKLRSLLAHANESAKAEDRQAFITLPGISNGAFGGDFRGQLIGPMYETLKDLLTDNQDVWGNLACVVLDGHSSGVCETDVIGNTRLRVRNSGGGANGENTLVSGNSYDSLEQLSHAVEFAESNEEGELFAACKRFKIVAWDHFSYEGNDWVGGSRFTDEATMAACNALEVITGLKGRYDKSRGGFVVDFNNPDKPQAFYTWEQVLKMLNLKQSIADRLYVYDEALGFQQEHGILSQALSDYGLSVQVQGLNLLQYNAFYEVLARFETQITRIDALMNKTSPETRSQWNARSGIYKMQLLDYVLEGLKTGDLAALSENLAAVGSIFHLEQHHKRHKFLGSVTRALHIESDNPIVNMDEARHDFNKLKKGLIGFVKTAVAAHSQSILQLASSDESVHDGASCTSSAV